MTVSRFIMTVFAASLVLVTPAIANEEPKPEPTLRDVMSRVDKILERLDQIERRVTRLENALSPQKFPHDKHGILRDPAGRPIGIWGIDYPSMESLRSEPRSEPPLQR